MTQPKGKAGEVWRVSSHARRVAETVIPMAISGMLIYTGNVWLGFGFLCLALALFAVIGRLWEMAAKVMLEACKSLTPPPTTGERDGDD
jgi:hypothetical protein